MFTIHNLWYLIYSPPPSPIECKNDTFAYLYALYGLCYRPYGKQGFLHWEDLELKRYTVSE